MAQYSAVFTTYGTQQLAKAIANNKPLTATHFAVGDGNGNAVTVSANQERLVNEKYRATVSAVSLDPRNNKQVIFELTIPEDIGGFYIREMGVFDANNKLVAYANCPESFKPTLASGSGKVQVMRMILLVASSNAVTLTVDDSVIFVTRGQLTPKDITANSANGFDNTGHSHAIDKASTTKAGIVQLTNDTGLDSENLGLTAKAGKVLAQGIAALRLALNNYIPNSKKSSRVDSDSTDDVATPKAVKAAYEKAVTAENLAKTKWTAQAATENTAGILPISHKTDGTDKNKFASEYAVGEAAKKGLPVGAIVAFPSAVTNPNGFLRANGSTFNASAFPDLFKVLGNSNTLPNLTRSDVGMTAYFAVDNIPAGWIAFDEISTQVTQQRYPELYRHLVAKYGSISAVPKAADRFIRNAGAGLSVGQTQEDAIRNITSKHLGMHAGDIDGAVYRGARTGVYHDGGTGAKGYIEFDASRVVPTADENRPKSLVLKLCIKALNSFDGVEFWVKSHGEVVNIGALDAGRLAQGLQDKADRNHTHTTSDIIDFSSGVTTLIKNVVRKNYSRTIKGTRADWDNGTSKSISVTGYTEVYPDGRIVQFFHLQNFRINWFAPEKAVGGSGRCPEIPVELWTSMPQKITWAEATLSRTEGAGVTSQVTTDAEAAEWIRPLWAFEKQGDIKNRLSFCVKRWTGGYEEALDMMIKVEGY